VGVFFLNTVYIAVSPFSNY